MSLNVPSGIVTIASGAQSGRGQQLVYVNALPVALFGGSGDVAISHYSGALNVNISGGSISVNISGQSVSVSGNIILVVSGGTLQVSGVVRALVSGDAVSTSISGNVVLVASGGTIQVSGTVRALVSGDAVITSISGNAITTSVSGNTITVLGTNVSGGVQVSGTVGVSGIVQIGSGSVSVASGQVIVTSGGVIPISIVSGSVSGIAVSVTSGGILPVFITSGAVDIAQIWPSYSLASYWSGAQPKGLIGLYNNGGTSGVAMEVTRLDVSIFASGNINRIDVILGSGVISGTAGTITKNFTNDVASVGSGWVDGGTQVSGNVIFTLDSILLEANSSGYMHNYTFEFNEIRTRPVIVLSGQEFWVKLTSGIGIGYIGIDWIERTLS